MRPPAPSTQGSTINESGGRKRRREPPFLRPELKGADPAHLVVRCVRGLKRARNRPPLPWRWWEHGSERPDSPENREAVLKTPAGSAEVPAGSFILTIDSCDSFLKDYSRRPGFSPPFPPSFFSSSVSGRCHRRRPLLELH